MAVTSARTIVNLFTGDIAVQSYLDAAENSASPAQLQTVTLASGANTITPPDGAVALTIEWPSDNETLVTLKGVTGDTGVVLHPTDPTSIGLNSDSDTLVLSAAAEITGDRLIWS